MTQYGCACQKAPFFSTPKVYDNPPPIFSEKKIMNGLFLELEWPKFSDTHVYAHIFTQIEGHL